MNKIASPQELQSELRKLLAYVESSKEPSREKLAGELGQLASRVTVRRITAGDQNKDKLRRVHADLERDLKVLKAIRLDDRQDQQELENIYERIEDATSDLSQLFQEAD